VRRLPHSRVHRAGMLSMIFALLLSIFSAASANATTCSPTSTTAANGYTTVEFDSVGTCTWSAPLGVTSLYVVVVGGGGSGGYGNQAGGGGGGEVLYTPTLSVASGSSHTIVVGAGGTGASSSGNNRGITGGSSSFDASSASGGGGGGGGGPYDGTLNLGLSGGSAGGGDRFGLTNVSATLTTSAGWTALGNAGGYGAGRQDNNPGVSNAAGTSNCFAYGAGGGGGGAMTVGQNAIATCTGSRPSDTINVIAGNGGAGAYILGRCLGGGGGSFGTISANDSGTASLTNSTPTPCNDINSGTQVSGTSSGGANGVAPIQNTGGGSAGGTSSPGSTAGANGVVLIRYYAPVTSGLVVSYDAQNPASYSGSGTTWNDLSGNGYNATLDTVTRSNSSGGYMAFSATSKAYVAVPTLPSTVDWSQGVSASFYTNFTSTQNWERIIDFGNGVDSSNILIARAGSTNDLTLAIKTDGNNWGQCEWVNSITNNTWAHYAVVADGTDCYLYINGALFNGTDTRTVDTAGMWTYPSTMTVKPVNSVARASNFIGKSNWSTDGYFDGGIRNVAVYNRGLSSNEVAIDYATQSQATTPAINSISFTSSPLNGTSYQSGETITVTTNWNESVTVTSAPRIPIPQLSSAYLTYASGSGTPTIIFTYVVGPSDSAGGGIGLNANSIDTSTGTLTDNAFNTPNYSFGAIAISTSQRVGVLTTTIVLSLPGNASTAAYRTVVTLTATVSSAGKVTFYLQNKPVPTCKNLNTVTSSSITATCSWKPSIMGMVTAGATLKPTASYLTAASTSIPITVTRRIGTR